MEFKEIQDLIKLVSKSTLNEVEIEQNDFKLKIKRKAPENNVIYNTSQPVAMPQSQAPVPSAAHQPADYPATPAQEGSDSKGSEHLMEFRSPMIGTFYRSSTPDQPPFIKVGDTVQKGDVLCIVEAMKLFNEIESEVDGKIVKIMIEDAQPVEYDQVLFLIDTKG